MSFGGVAKAALCKVLCFVLMFFDGLKEDEAFVWWYQVLFSFWLSALS